MTSQRHGIRSLLAGLASSLLALPLAALAPVPDFGDNPGALDMFLHVPAATTPGLPIVVGLHGCTQNASSFDDETGLVALAEETPFLLLLPQQRPENMERNCFRFYDEDDNQAGRGESASILQMIDTVIASEAADPSRVFVLGLSAGGGMSGVLLANYPDRFAGGAIIAGPPYGCNHPKYPLDPFWYIWSPWFGDGADAAYACGLFGWSTKDREPEDWAQTVLDAAQSPPDAWPFVSIWQGEADDVVDPDNLDELTEQWTRVHGIDLDADVEEVIAGATRRVYLDDAGQPKVETWDLPELGHSVPIDPDAATVPCGKGGDHMEDANICAVRYIAEFWQLR